MTVLEQSFHPSIGKNLKKGLIVALALGATLSIAFSLLAQLAVGLAPTDWVLLVIVAPFTEEFFKGLAILIVAWYVWKTIPSRRYGAALGAATGLGFAIAETIIYIIGASPDQVLSTALSRLVIEPFMHPLWSAFAGVGFFVFLTKKSTGGSAQLGLGLLFIFTGLFAHVTWNSLAVLLSSLGIWPVVFVEMASVFPVFTVALRDFLGGHFNFRSFFRSLPESWSSNKNPSPPPPPP